jgi:hypothetical protein
VGIRIAGVAFLALVAGVVLSLPALVSASTISIGGLYGAELAIADAPLDVATPALAAGLLLAAELGYWSIEERGRWQGQAGDSLRRAALVALLAVGAALVAAVLMALVDVLRTSGLALDLVGATAAAAVLAIAALVFRQRDDPAG